MKNPKAYLIDGNSLAYRAFYALPDTMRTSSGIITNAIYGFTTMLLKILDEKPDFVAISFDRPEPTFRHKEYKEYKATRDKAPPTLHPQMPYVKEIAEAFDIPIYEMVGFEADDVIGTLAKEAEQQGFEAIILTGDLDPLQLVNDHIKVLTTRKGLTDTVLYGEKEVEERYGGLKPKQLIDYKALKGDSSDNIPGVPKVGEKTAEELLKEFGTLENIYQNLDKIKKPALHNNLKNNLPLAEMSRRLGTIVTNVPLQIDFNKMKRRDIDWSKVLPVFQKLEFGTLFKKYQDRATGFSKEDILKEKREAIKKFDYQCVDNTTKLEKLIAKLEKAPAFAFDCETTSLNTFEAKLVGISFSVKYGEAFYVPAPDLKALKPVFESDKLKIGHNLKYDIEVLLHQGVKVSPPLFDTMVAAYLLDPTSSGYGLKKLAAQFLDRPDMIKFDELEGESFTEVPQELATDYACSDADATLGLYEVFSKELAKQADLNKLSVEIEMPLLSVLIDMEENGVYVDSKKLGQLSTEIQKQMKELERNIFAIAGETFNLNSPKQLAQILFEKLNIPPLKKTKTGYSTDSEVLEELSAQFEIAEKLLEYRGLSKLISTYVDVLPTLINPKTGRIHANFNQTITATGRLSSSNPNMQNIPTGGKIREAFVPQFAGWKIVAADYSQIELRILAHLSQDPALIKAFKENQDVHQAAADELGISRAAAKTVNFGIIYGISDFGLARSLKIKKTEAAEYIEKYFNRHKKVKEFMDATIKMAHETGKVQTMLGRKRPLPEINSPNYGQRSFAERTAINTPVQGTAADMIKIAMLKVHERMQKEKLKSMLILQVHDELVFECPENEVDKVKKTAQEEMIKALPLSVPVKVDIGTGDSWAEAK